MTPDQRPPKPYKLTLFDRFGTEVAGPIRAIVWSLPITIIGGLGVGMLASQHGRTGLSIIWWGLAGAVLFGIASALVVVAMSDAAGAGFKQIIWPSGSSTPYENQFSLEESMVMRGDLDGALALYEEHMRADPASVAPRLRAAELCARDGRDLDRAVLLYREVQRLPRVSESDDVYATNRLIDIYLGPMANKDKAISELRRLIGSYPTSGSATRARQALVELKRQLRTEEQA